MEESNKTTRNRNRKEAGAATAEIPQSADVTITLPLPPRELSPNARVHHMVKAKAVRRYRRAAWACALEAQAPLFGRRPRWAAAKASATFYFPDRWQRDADNLLASLKAAFDGLADAGLIADDAGLTHAPVVVDVDADNPRVEIRLDKLA